jgi:hypothetical protein
MGGKLPVFMVAAVLVFPMRPDARHGQEPPWLNALTDQRGMHCYMQRDCVPVHSIDVLHQAHDGTTDIVVERWAGAVYDYAIVPAPPRTLHCMVLYERRQQWYGTVLSYMVERRRIHS